MGKLKHGMRNTRQYSIWNQMVQRCKTITNKQYPEYGGRGITVCEKWLTFSGFWEDMREGYADDLEIDRISVNLGYYKENCRWTTEKENAYNQRKRKNNTSGRTGVSFDREKNKWKVFIQKNGKLVSLGYFLSFEEAVRVREEAELEVYGYIKE